MCLGNPFCSMVGPIGLVNMAANHVTLQHGVEITSEARGLLAAKIQHTANGEEPEKLTKYLESQQLSHLDLVQLAEKQFLQALPHSAAAGDPAGTMGKAALEAGIATKAWSPIWK